MANGTTGEEPTSVGKALCERIEARIALSNAAWWLVENRRRATVDQVTRVEADRDAARVRLARAASVCRCSRCSERRAPTVSP